MHQKQPPANVAVCRPEPGGAAGRTAGSSSAPCRYPRSCSTSRHSGRDTARYAAFRNAPRREIVRVPPEDVSSDGASSADVDGDARSSSEEATETERARRPSAGRDVDVAWCDFFAPRADAGEARAPARATGHGIDTISRTRGKSEKRAGEDVEVRLEL
jgi:hypothetical protein